MIPSIEQVQIYNPNYPNSIEALRQPFYDFQAYAAAGTTSQIFFQQPVGQGGRTYADTNMSLAGQFPAPTSFLVENIQIAYFPGTSISQTIATARALQNWIDVVAFSQAGWLEFQVGSKVIFRDAPLGKFPTNFTIGGVATISAIDSDLAAGGTADAQFARMVGKVYEIVPILIPQNQNFSVTLNFAVAVTGVAGARVGVLLDGIYYRRAQ